MFRKFRLFNLSERAFFSSSRRPREGDKIMASMQFKFNDALKINAKYFVSHVRLQKVKWQDTSCAASPSNALENEAQEKVMKDAARLIGTA